MCALHVEETLVGGGKKKEKNSQKFSTRPKKSTCRALFRICLPGAWSQKALQKIEGKKNKELVCLVPGRKGDKNKIK
jgi:hypothetical protein